MYDIDPVHPSTFIFKITGGKSHETQENFCAGAGHRAAGLGPDRLRLQGSAADGDTVTVKLGVVGAIYDDIWKPAQEALKAEGINLEIVQFSDYVTPNNALANGEIDLNAFQHRIYLQGEIANYGYEIQNIGNTFIAPMSLFSSKISSVSELKDGDIIAIPDDLTNGGRALKVLESAGIITLNSAAGFNPTLDDIQTYNIGVTIKELKANVIVSALPDVTAAIVNNNYALDFGLSASDAIFADDRLDIEDYWNLIAARTADRQGGNLPQGRRGLSVRRHARGVQYRVPRLLHPRRLGSGSAAADLSMSEKGRL